jgi:hypothetical protein
MRSDTSAGRRLPGVDIEEEIDHLYGVPHDEFVAERDALAKRLKGDGDAEAAADVKALRKPTVGAWALNQAVRRRSKETAALLETGERLREAHEKLLGGGDAKQLRAAMQEERALTAKLADCAEAIASEAGKSGPALRDRVRATLHAASVDEEAREELASGRFVREREAVGLGAFGSSEAAEETGGATRGGRGRAGGGRAGGGRAGSGGRQAADGERGRAGGAAGGSRSRGSRAASGDGAGRGRAVDAVRGERTKRGRTPSGATEERATPTREERAAEVARAREERAAAEAQARDDRIAEAEGKLTDARDELAAAESDHETTLSTLESAREALREAEVAEREARRVARAHSREVAKQERAVERLRPKR